MRFEMVDRIEELKRGSYAIGIKCISLSDDVFEHHFPGQPVYPGSLLIESMAQLGGALLELSLRDSLDYCPRCVLSMVKAKFRDMVLPGTALRMRAEVLAVHEAAAQVRCKSESEGKVHCEAELTYVILRLDDPRLQQSREAFLDVITRNTRHVSD
jgi:3-hydroxymyristoyl/3-hydroxydecanoyl-(acyl carrier protein) dehydratase